MWLVTNVVSGLSAELVSGNFGGFSGGVVDRWNVVAVSAWLRGSCLYRCCNCNG